MPIYWSISRCFFAKISAVVPISFCDHLFFFVKFSHTPNLAIFKFSLICPAIIQYQLAKSVFFIVFNLTLVYIAILVSYYSLVGHNSVCPNRFKFFSISHF